MIKVHRLVVPGFFGRNLRFEAIRLILRVIELAETVSQLSPTDKELEAIGNEGIVIAASS